MSEVKKIRSSFLSVVFIAIMSAAFGTTQNVLAAGANITAVALGDVHDMNDGKENTNPEGDTWITFWRENGEVLTSINDGAGWDNGSDTTKKGIAKLIGNPNYNTTTFWGTSLNPGTLGNSRKNFMKDYCLGGHYSLYEQNGILYDAIENTGVSPGRSGFIKSTDGGVNWSDFLGDPVNVCPSDFLSSDSTSMFKYGVSFVRYGKGDGVPNVDEADKYLYVNFGYCFLGRVEKAKFPNLNKEDYEWFAGLDAQQHPIWSPHESDEVIIPGLHEMSGPFTSSKPAHPTPTCCIIYNYGLGKYLMLGYSSYWPAGENPEYFNWCSGLPRYHVLAADHPWGPFVDAGSASLCGSTVWEYLMCNKYTSRDGKKMWIDTSGSLPSWTGWETHAPWHYGFQYMPLYLSTGQVVKYEAEDATLSGNVHTESSYTPYSGTGYVTGFSGAGDIAHFKITQKIKGEGWHIVSIRYTNPLHNGNTMSVYVNGRKARTITLAQNNNDNRDAGGTFNPDHEWTNSSGIYYLNNGTGNTIEIRCNSETGDIGSGILIDSISVSSERTYNEGKNVAPAAKATASSGTASNAKKGYADFSTEWTANGAVGEWVKLDWGASRQTLNKVILYGKANAATQVTAGTLTFSDGSTVPVGKLQRDGKAGEVITFPKRKVTWIKFTIDSVTGGTTNAGLGEFMAAYEPGITPTAMKAVKK